ncbi:MAG: hypothetical protein ACREMT_04890 [Vulcanimicrobiaceae bacterium]
MNQIVRRYIAALTIAGASMLPAVALAQGAYDSSHPRIEWTDTGQPYYYDQSHQRHMMKAEAARQYAKQQDPQWYSQHESEWRNDPKAFMKSWRRHEQWREAHMNQGG